MGERIDEKALFEGASKAADLADLGGDDMEKRGFARAQFWRDEALRARSEEARLLEESRAQKEQIKALADALEALNNRRIMHYVSAPGQHTIEMTNHEVSTMVAALRLAGRLT